MPKGATSRPYNRKEKQALSRQKQRNELYKKVSKNAIKGKNISNDLKTAKESIYSSDGAKKDRRILDGRSRKSDNRKIANAIGSRTGQSRNEYTKRTPRKSKTIENLKKKYPKKSSK